MINCRSSHWLCRGWSRDGGEDVRALPDEKISPPHFLSLLSRSSIQLLLSWLRICGSFSSLGEDFNFAAWRDTTFPAVFDCLPVSSFIWHFFFPLPITSRRIKGTPAESNEAEARLCAAIVVVAGTLWAEQWNYLSLWPFPTEAETIFMSVFSWRQPEELTTRCFDFSLLLFILQLVAAKWF